MNPINIDPAARRPLIPRLLEEWRENAPRLSAQRPLAWMGPKRLRFRVKSGVFLSVVWGRGSYSKMGRNDESPFSLTDYQWCKRAVPATLDDICAIIYQETENSVEIAGLSTKTHWFHPDWWGDDVLGWTNVRGVRETVSWMMGTGFDMSEVVQGIVGYPLEDED